VPPGRLVGVAEAGRETLVVPGVGRCRSLAVPFDDAGFLLVARSGDDFTPEEAVLLRCLSRILALMLRTFRVLEAERRLRLESERQAEENRRLLATVQERQTLLERLFRIQRSISHRMPIQEVLDSITEGAAELLGDEAASLRIVDEQNPGFTRLVSAVGLSARILESVYRISIEHGLSGKAIAQNQLVLAEDDTADPNAHRQLVSDGMRSAMAAPVSRDGKVVGSLVVASRRARRYSPAEQEVLLAFAEYASLALNDASAEAGMRKAFDAALHQANHDPLTGLPNRTLVLDRLTQALSRARRRSSQVTVLFADLDRFKLVNDSLGHSAGDELLVRVSQRLRGAVREEDTVGRLAGDEFVVICQDMSERAATIVAERVA
jgi:GGDEF domain-containing protein